MPARFLPPASGAPPPPAALNIPVIIGAISMVHWGRWNFVPTETHPMGGFQFQAVLLLIMFFLVITGNRGVANNQAAISA